MAYLCGNYRSKFAKQIHRKKRWFPNGCISSIASTVFVKNVADRHDEELHMESSSQDAYYDTCSFFSYQNIDGDASRNFSRQLLESFEREYEKEVCLAKVTSVLLWVEATGNPGIIALRADRISMSMKSGRRRGVPRRWMLTMLDYATTTVAHSVACALRTVNATRSTDGVARGNKRGCSLRDLRADPPATS